MNARQRNKMRMVLATQAMLLKEREAWSHHEAFAEGVIALGEAVEDIKEAVQCQVGRNGAKASQEKATRELAQLAFEIAAATFACAAARGHVELKSRVAYGRWEVMSGSQADIHGRCANILAAAREVEKLLPKFGVTAARLELLQKRLDAYDRARTRPCERKIENTVAAQDLRKAFAEAMSLLKEQLDKLLVQFEETQPQFVAKYRAARRIINLPGSRTATAEEAVASEPIPDIVPEPELLSRLVAVG
jgi:hypothetical protein